MASQYAFYSRLFDGQPWSAHVQPEGQLYFSKEIVFGTNREAHLRVYTEEFMHNEDIHGRMNWFVAQLTHLLAQRTASSSATMPNRWEAVLEFRVGNRWTAILGDSDHCYYYLVDHGRRTVMWAHEYKAKELGEKVGGIPSIEYLRKFHLSCQLCM